MNVKDFVGKVEGKLVGMIVAGLDNFTEGISEDADSTGNLGFCLGQSP